MFVRARSGKEMSSFSNPRFPIAGEIKEECASVQLNVWHTWGNKYSYMYKLYLSSFMYILRHFLLSNVWGNPFARENMEQVQ